MAEVLELMPEIPKARANNRDPHKKWRVEDLSMPDGSPMTGPDGFLAPSARNFSMVVNAATRVYSYRWDEAMRDNFVAARAMRRDTFLLGLLEERILPTINRDFRLEIDDDADPFQVHVRDSLTKVIRNIRDFDAMKRAMLDGVWFGRAGCQWNYTRNSELGGLWGIGKWDPIHGDSIQYTYDGVPAIMMDSMTAGWYANHGAKWGSDLRYTDRGGVALCLQRPHWRERFGIHRHILQKADYFEGELAGSVQGYGLRGQIYWNYVVREDALTWMLAYMQAVGMMDLLVFNYPAGNAAAEAQQMRNASQVIGKAAIVCPRNPNGNWPAVEQIQMNAAGMKALQNLVADYFDRHIERMIVGQSMSSGGGQLQGLGDTGRAELARATKDEILVYDSNRQDQTYTYDLVAPLKKYNYPRAKFPVRFKSILPDLEAAEKVQNGLNLVSIQVPIKMDEIREAAGYSRPEEGDEVVGGPPPMPEPSMGGAPGAPAPGGQPVPFANAGNVPEMAPAVPGGGPIPLSRLSKGAYPMRFNAPGMGTMPAMGFPGGSNTYIPSFRKRGKKMDFTGFARYGNDKTPTPYVLGQPTNNIWPKVTVRGDVIDIDTGERKVKIYPGDTLYSQWMTWIANNRQRVWWVSVSDPQITPQRGRPYEATLYANDVRGNEHASLPGRGRGRFIPKRNKAVGQNTRRYVRPSPPEQYEEEPINPVQIKRKHKLQAPLKKRTR